MRGRLRAHRTFWKLIQEAVEEVAEHGLAVGVPHGRVPLALGVQEPALAHVLGGGDVAVVRENPVAVSLVRLFIPKAKG